MWPTHFDSTIVKTNKQTNKQTKKRARQNKNSCNITPPPPINKVMGKQLGEKPIAYLLALKMKTYSQLHPHP